MKARGPVVAGAALLGVAAGGGDARSQSVVDLPAVRSAPAAGTFALEWIEAPAEIGFGTMAVNVWATVAGSGPEPLAGAILAWTGADGEQQRTEMRPVDGAFDSAREEVVGTVDTYAWRSTGRREFEIRVAGAGGVETKIGAGALDVKDRISTPDLVLLDERGVAHPWLGSGAGGFTATEDLATGAASRPIVADVDGDGLSDLTLPGGFGEVYVYRNRGAGRFEAGRSIAVGAQVADAVIGDLDGNRFPDLVTVASDRSLEIRLDLADAATQAATLPLVPELLELADLDGDGRTEIVVALLGMESGEVQVWTPTGPKSATWVPTMRLPPPTGLRGRVVDLAWVAPAGPLCLASSSSGEAVLESWGPPADTRPGSEPVLLATTSVPGEPLALVPGRFGREGAAACLVAVHGLETTTVWELRDGEAARRLQIDGSDPVAFAALDLDGDGDDDLVTGGDEIRIWIQLEVGDFREAGESPYLLDSRAVALLAGSLDERGP